MRQHFGTASARIMRGYFNRWNRQARKIAVQIYNEEEFGRINLQAWRSRWECWNLKNLIRKDGQDEHPINQISDDKSKQQMKKAIIRLIVNCDPDLRIMPIYFDRLRQHARIRKLWKYIIKIMNRQSNRAQDLQRLAKSFQRWRRHAIKIT
jgi:hypothetical protein